MVHLIIEQRDTQRNDDRAGEGGWRQCIVTGGLGGGKDEEAVVMSRGIGSIRRLSERRTTQKRGDSIGRKGGQRGLWQGRPTWTVTREVNVDSDKGGQRGL